MNKVYDISDYDISDKERRYDEASGWIAKLDKALSEEEQKRLQAWMADNPKNQEMLLEMAKLWDKMAVLSRLSDLFPEPAARPARSPRIALAAAAMVLIAVTAGFWGASVWTSRIAPDAVEPDVAVAAGTVYETAIGEQLTVMLDDGTQVTLNTNSRIEVAYTERQRLLTLEHGEIHLQVAEDRDRPLSVIAVDRIVRAVGTAFSVEITADQQIELVVTEGRVVVGIHGATSPVTVVAGEELVLGVPDETVTEVSAEDIEVKLSWRQGSLIFRGESLEEALVEVGRYTTVEFVFLDDDIRQERIVGRFRAGDVDALLVALQVNLNIAHQRTDDGKVLLSSL